jgi:uncharacterized SAM-binding protein YcdF (DUF218 family)
MFWLLLAVGAVFFSGLWLEIWGRSCQPDPEASAIVLVGCPPGPALLRRAATALTLARCCTHLPIVISGGGIPSEASVAAQVLIQGGIDTERIILEEKSTSTEENARFSARLLAGHTAIVVVSDTYHLFRCQRVFRCYFSRVSGLSAPTPIHLKMIVRELIVLFFYGWRGYLG